MKIVLQHDQRDCGAACLSMIAMHYGYNETISFFRELTKTDNIGTTIYGIVNGAKQIGLEAKGLSGELKELLDGINDKDIKLPFIAHCVSEENMLHYIIVYKIKNGKVYGVDPAKGSVKYELDYFENMWTGYIINLYPGSEYKKKKKEKNSFLQFFLLLKGQIGKIAGIVFLSLFLAIIGIIGSFIFMYVMDGLEESVSQEHEHEDYYEDEENAESNADNIVDKISITLNQSVEDLSSVLSKNKLSTVFISLLFLYFLQVLLAILRGVLVVNLSKNIDVSLSLRYYHHIIDLPVSSIRLRKIGEYLSRASDTSIIRNAVSSVTITLLMDSLMVIACGGILYSINGKMFFVACIMIVLYFFVFIVFKKPIDKINRRVMENNAIVESYIKECIDGSETVKAYNAEQNIKGKIKEKYQAFIDSNVKGGLISISQDSMSIGIEMIGTLIILWIGFILVFNGDISLGTLITYYALLEYFTNPIKNIMGLQPTIQAAIVSADRLHDILDIIPEDKKEKERHIPSTCEWEMKDVDFRYGTRELILSDISFHISIGEKIAFVGESGSGKTTIANLLMGFYKIENGSININGHNVEEYSLDELRSSIAYVNQNTFLFSDTIKNNLKLSSHEISDQEIEKMCVKCDADSFIRDLPMSYDTPVDERGINLSGGQIQKLSLVRALLRKPKLLILDEATSNLDVQSENRVKELIFEEEKKLTCIIIAHKLSLVTRCDRIYVLEKGTIVECGTHKELLNKEGLYCRMWNAQ